MDALIAIRKRLQPVVESLGLRVAAQHVYRRLLRWRYGLDGVATARVNGREWKLLLEIALLDEVYEPGTHNWLKRTLKPGDAVLDIGANVGLVSLEAAALVGPAGRVIAIEPAPGNAGALRRHVELNGLAGRVRVVEAVYVALDGGTTTLAIPGDQAGDIGSGPTLMTHRYLTGTERHVEVACRSVDGLCEGFGVRPAAVKIDVEGAELQVVRGATQTLAECRPTVWLAFHPYAFPDPRAATEELFALFQAAGYTLPPPGADGALTFGEHEFRHAQSETASRK